MISEDRYNIQMGKKYEESWEYIYNPKISEVNLTEIISLDTEGSSLDTLTATCSVISIADPGYGQVYGFDINSGIYTHEEILELLGQVQKCRVVIAHNAKYDIGIIKSNFGILLRNCFCTMLASQLIDNGYGYVIKKENLRNTDLATNPNKIYYTKNMVGNIPAMPSPHGLHGCLRRYLEINLTETVDKKRMQMSFVDLPKGIKITEKQLEYACSDVQYLYQLYLAESKWIEERNQQIQIKLENKLIPTIVKMEQKGCLIDSDLHKDNISKWKEELNNIELKLDKILFDLGEDNVKFRGGVFANKRVKQEVIQTSLFAGCEEIIANENHGNINYGSAHKLKDIFERAGEPLPVDDAGKVSFGEEPIKFFITNHPGSILKLFLELILDHREYSKLLSTYGTNLLNLLDKQGRMRTSYTQAFTDTGRLTSSAIIKDQLGLNLSNLPKRSDVRRIFIPDEGYSFVDSDMTGSRKILLITNIVVYL